MVSTIAKYKQVQANRQTVYFGNTLTASDINNIECTISATEYRISSILEFESKVGWECSEGEEIRSFVE